MQSALKGAQVSSPLESDDMDTATAGAVSWDLGNSFNLRLFIHYVGDIHQPLHSTSRFTKDYPEGDFGGNLFKLTSKLGVSNIHSLWDSAMYQYSQDLSLPLNSSSWDWLNKEAARLVAAYPESTYENINTEYHKWNQETFKLS